MILITNLYFTGFPLHLELQGLCPHQLTKASQILLRCPKRFLKLKSYDSIFCTFETVALTWMCTMEASVCVPSAAKTHHETVSSGHSFKSYSCLEPLHLGYFGAFLQIQNHIQLLLARLGSHALECTKPALGLVEGVL